MRRANRSRRDRRQVRKDQPPVIRWLQVGTVAVGVGAAMACGAGVAQAGTGEDTDPSTTTKPESTPDVSSKTLSDNKSEVDPVTPPAALSRHAGPVMTITRHIAEEFRSAFQTTTKSRVVGRTAFSAQATIKTAPTGGKSEVVEVEPADTQPAEHEVVEKAVSKAFEIDRSESMRQKRRFVPPAAEDHDVSSASAVAKSRFQAFGSSGSSAGVEGSPALTPAPTTFADTSRTVAVVSAPRVSADAVDPPAYPAQLRAPVTLQSMVTDVLRWFGLRPPNVTAPVPAVPVPHIIELLWIGLRRVEYTVANDYPTTRPGPGAQTPKGGIATTTGELAVTVTGSLNAEDADGDKLTYTVVTKPEKGTVEINKDGTYTYKADPTFGHVGGQDSFTVVVGDTAGNPWHLHGLAELFGRGPTTVTVPVTVAAVNRAPIAPSTITAPAPGADAKVIGSIGASDPDLDTLTYSIFKDPIVVDLKPKGEATIDAATGKYTYTPAAWARHEAAAVGASPMTDTFYVTTTDSYGASVRTAVTVSITADNKNPTATPVVSQDPVHQTERIVTNFILGALWSQTTASTAVMLITPNVADQDDFVQNVTVTATNADSTLGTVAKNADGTFTYTPTVYSITKAAGGTAQIDTVTLSLNDGHGGIVSVPVRVDIASVIDARTTLGGDLTVVNQTIDTSGLTNPDDELEVTSLNGFITRVGGDLILKINGRTYNLGQASSSQSVQVVTSGNKAYVYLQSSLAAILDLGTA
jgi:VCBS repeat-containing protein